MAKLTKSILGRVSGSLGDITFRQRNGKNYLASRPGSFMPGTDEASVSRRAKFALSVKLASLINSNKELKSIWDSRTPQGKTAYNHLVKTNYKLIATDSVTQNTLLTPGYGFNAVVNSITYNADNIGVEIGAIGSNAGIDPALENEIELISIISLSAPNDEQYDAAYLQLNSISQQLSDLSSDLSFALPISNQLQNLLTKYDAKLSLFCLITKTTAGEVIHYSNTFSG